MAPMTIIPGDDHYLLICGVVTVVLQLVCFAIAYTLQFDKITDFAGSTNFILLALLTLFAGGSYAPRQVLVSAMLLVSRAELATFLLYRVLRRGKDERFDAFRKSFCSFLGFWIFQMVWAWAVSLPVIFANAEPAQPPLGAADWVGLGLFALGFATQVAADLTKDAFRAEPANRGRVCDVGVWRYSRHPNFFGEVLLWVGIFVAATPCFGATWGWATVVSPVLTFVLLMFLSGMPTAEGDYQKRFMRSPAARDAFIAYRERTSPLVPLPRWLYGALPKLVKQCLLCEFPLYEVSDWTYCGDDKGDALTRIVVNTTGSRNSEGVDSPSTSGETTGARADADLLGGDRNGRVLRASGSSGRMR